MTTLPVRLVADQGTPGAAWPTTDAAALAELQATVAHLSTVITRLSATLTVAGTVSVSNHPVPQTDALTDAQLRSTPLPVSGTVATGALTNAQIRATPLPVSGAISVSNLPATQEVAGSVAVTNLPATQEVAGSVAVTNLPDTQQVAGSVSVTNLPATQQVAGTVAVSNIPAPQTDALTDAELRAAPLPVSLGSTVVTDTRSLTERMFARAPQVGHSMWIDTADPTHIYLVEATSAETAGTSPVFQGIRVTKDASGNPLGKVQVATDFAWSDRATAGWA